MSSAAGAPAPTPPNVPYQLPVHLPRAGTSPAVASTAPYTPAVLSLIAQLLPDNPPTQAEVANASAILHGGTNSSCHNVGPTAAPTGTTPSVMPMCWTDAQGVNVTSGSNVRNTTGPEDLMGLGATFDRTLGNAWGQTEGRESRELMVTGLFGPQTDLDRLPNWGRNLTTTGEDPFLSSQMVAAQINGIQSTGAMSEMKHFAVYNGQNQSTNTEISDQALHEIYLTPYEGGFVNAQAAATMCSYQIWQDTSTNLPNTVSSIAPSSPLSNGSDPQTWPLNESHFSCEQPLTLTYALRDLWGSAALVGSDYPATHSTAGMPQGEDQEMPTSNGFFSSSPTLTTGQQTDPTGDTCADTSGNAVDCSAPGAVRVGGIPGPGCPTYGCAAVDAVANGTLPVSVFDQSLARILYQQQRFGMLGCSESPALSTCTNAGGINGDRTGTAPLPAGPASGASPAVDLGTKSGDEAIAEKESEEGATLLKNDGGTLPITKADEKGGVLVTGVGAEYTIADPTTEASIGFLDRDQINPLQQLQAFSGDSSAFTYVPAGAPSGEPVPSSALSTSDTSVTGGLARTTGPGSPTTDPALDFTTASSDGQAPLAPGSYTWTGFVFVPTTDSYAFRFQMSSGVPTSDVTFTLDGTNEPLTTADPVYGTNGGFGGGTAIQGSPTNAGYTEAGLTNDEFVAGSLTGGTFHPVTITFDNTTTSPASFRFAYSRAQGDIADAARAAVGKKMAIVFVDDNGAPTEIGGGAASTTIPNPYGDDPATISAPESLPPDQVALVNAVAAVNPNTVVVLNTTNPVLLPFVSKVKSVLEMWFSGEEGGTSTARLLLGLADPSGHTPMTWPANATDTIWGYDETTPLYPGDTIGPHLERLNDGPNGTTDETEGIYEGYRFFDKEGITPMFAFGSGLSYTSFSDKGLTVKHTADGGLAVSFTVKNTGTVAGTAVPQVYVGAPSVQPSGVQFAVRSLSGFTRVSLAPGVSQKVTIQVPARQLEYWSDAQQRWMSTTGTRTVWVGTGDSPSTLPLHTKIGSQANGNMVCQNTAINATVINGDLTVPDGSWCDLVSVTVNGSVKVSGSSGLRIRSTAIRGDLTITGSAQAADPNSAGSDTVCASTIGGDVKITGSGRPVVWSLGGCGDGGGNQIAGSVTFNNNVARGSQVEGNTIGGKLTCTGNGEVSSTDNTVAGKSSGQCAA